MIDLLSIKHRHLVWQDEINDPFILLKFCEIYRYSDAILRILCWSKSRSDILHKFKFCEYIRSTSDGLYIFDIAPKNVELIIDLGHHTKRPDVKGGWIRDKEKRLGHKVKPFKPAILQPEPDPDNRPKGLYNG